VGRDICEKVMGRKGQTEHENMQDPVIRAERSRKYKTTMTERYGVSNIMEIHKKRAKHEATCLERYGFKNAASSEGIKERVRQSNRKRFGVDYPTQLPETAIV
jgi:hypothetical protein